MNIKGIIFDLDQTLVDTDDAKKLRDEKDWVAVYKIIPRFILYPGVEDLFRTINEKGIVTAVVTSSPRTYCEKVLTYWKIKVDYTVCFGDTRKHKPQPEPILKAISLMNGIDKSNIISIGDDPNDIIASKSAGVISGGALWGRVDAESLIIKSPDYIFSSVNGIKHLISK